MLEHVKIRNTEDYFVELKDRSPKGVFFYRLNGYSGEMENFIKKYYDVARRTGVVIEGKIPNPDEKNLSYYQEMMGTAFQMNLGFITSGLKKWLPRMTDYQRGTVAASIYDSLDSMRKAGKTENMLKNAYIKFMCWLYYKFERIINQLGENRIPKILYEGDISNYELMLISILSNAGCDVLLLQYHGDQAYRKVDSTSALSDNMEFPGLTAFPPEFSLKQIREKLKREADQERLYGPKPSVINCTNAWIKGNGFEDIRESFSGRGNDPQLFYNCFYRINGVEDKVAYANELYRLQAELKNAKRNVVIVNREITRPTPDEIAGIRRNAYANREQMILDLSRNIQYSANMELQKIMHKAFVDIMLSESGQEGNNINKLTNKAVYLLCWLRRYQSELFSNWKNPQIGCFIYLGGCRNENEAMFVRFLARLPVDVLILCPNLNVRCCLEDHLLYELNFSESIVMEEYPQDNSQVRVGTVAYHAERELDTLMYQDSGIYRNQQYARANIINLSTMYEEIKILWDQELKYRPNFGTADGVVTIPVIFAKVCGVKNGLVPQYWSSIKELATPDTLVIKSAPYIEQNAPNDFKALGTELYKNGKVQKNRIKNHPGYPYAILRDDIQDLMFEKLQIMIDQKLIKGIGENGMEYTVAATVLNLPKEILRLLQKFDFTKKNPKLVYINTTETIISLEDSILTAFLNLIGFDILFFIPTGYQNIEKYFNRKLMEEHQIGEYVYDLTVPDLKNIPLMNTRLSWRDKIFKRGN